MKNTLKSLVLSIAMLSSANAAVTFGFATHTGTSNGPNGLPIVDSEGRAILNSTNSVFASIGYMSDAAGLTLQNVLTRFIPIDSTPLVPSLVSGANPRNGLISGNDYNDTGTTLPAGYTANFQGKAVYVLIGNSATLSASTAVALFSFGTFGTPDTGGNLVQNFQLNSASIPVFGTLTAIPTTGLNGQPVAGNAFVNGVALASIAPVPETSTSLLGALGALALLRRRRN